MSDPILPIWERKSYGLGETVRISDKRILLSVDDPDGAAGPPFKASINCRVTLKGPFFSTDTARKRVLVYALARFEKAVEDIKELLKEFDVV